MLVFAKPTDEFYFFEDIDSKEKRTKAQNNWFYMLLSWISKHLGQPLQEVKIYLLSWCFGTHKLKLSKKEIEIPNISRTSDLTKENAIFFIDVILQFCKAKNIPITITPRQVQSLYDSYN
jgi:hypothetical protein